jgi:hypothetical protein
MSSKRRFRGGGRRFIQLYHNVKNSQAYHDLSVYGRCALIELLSRHTGINNGMIGLGVRELSNALKCSHGTAIKAFRELDDAGLARPVKPGAWRGKKASEWRLTFYRCEATGELPILNWEPRSEVTSESAKDHVGKRKIPLRSRGKAQTPKNPIVESALRSRGEAHIDIYQEGTASSTVTEPASWETSSEGEREVPNNFGSLETQKFDDPRIVSLRNWGAGSQLKPWTRPTILSDEPRDFHKWPVAPDEVAA